MIIYSVNLPCLLFISISLFSSSLLSSSSSFSKPQKTHRADLAQRKAIEEEMAKRAAVEAAMVEEGGEVENPEDVTADNSGNAGEGNEIPDASPSALPTTESQLQPAATVASIGGSAAAAGGTTVASIMQQRQHEDLIGLRSHLPSFVAACMNIQSRVTAVSTLAENGNDLPQRGSYTSPSLTNVSERILRQLYDSVDLFVQAIVAQAKKRVEVTRTLASSTVAELDEWIGSVVAAETASVGHMRRSMTMAISSALETREEEDGRKSTAGGIRQQRQQQRRQLPMQVQMRYGVEVPDDGPTSSIFDVRGSSSTLRTPTSFLLPTSCLRTLIQALRTAALESSRLSGKGSKENDTTSSDPMGTISRSTFVDVLYRAATSGQLTEMWSPLSRNAFVQIAQQFDSTNTGVVRWREFVLVLIYSLLPKRNGIPDVASLRKMYSAFVRADDMSPTQSSADVVEWNEYCSVTLWFESDERVHEEVSWQIRDLIWLIFSENPTNESRGQLPYPKLILSLAMTPLCGDGFLRSIGLFKAFQVQSIVSQCRVGTLHRQGVKNLLSQKLCNPILSEEIVNEVLNQAYDNFGLSEEDEIGFEALSQSMSAVQEMSGVSMRDEDSSAMSLFTPMPFTLKDIYPALRQCASSN